MSGTAAPERPDVPLPDPEKEVVRLPDGRELTYYRFPDPPPPPARPAPGEER